MARQLQALADSLAQTAFLVPQCLVSLPDYGGGLKTKQALLQIEPGSVAVTPPLAGAPRQRNDQVVEVLQLLLETAPGMDAAEPQRNLLQRVARQFEPRPDELPQAAPFFCDELPAGEGAFGNDFRGGARRGGAHVRDEIADGEIDLMTHGGNHRQG